MHALIVTAITLASISTYGAIGMLIGVGYYRRVEAGCRDNYYCDHAGGAVFGAFFWPLGVWLLAGILLATAEDRRKVAAGREADRLREIERETGIRCYHDNYAVDCVRCAQTRRSM